MSDLSVASPLRNLSSPTLGYIAVGVSAFALLAAGPRVLGPDGYSNLAVAWTVSTIFGFGVAIPGEQTVIRGVAGGATGNVARSVRIRLLLATIPLVGCWIAAVMGAELLGVDGSIWWFAMALAALAWALLMGPRGTLAGRAEYKAFGSVLVCESVVRLALVAAAWIVPRTGVAATVLLAAAVGLPLLVSVGVAFVLASRARSLRDASDDPAPVPLSSTLSEQSSLTVLALAIQVLLNSAPLWLSVRPDTSAATAGLYVSITSYMRIPALLTGGALAVVLSSASASHAQGDRSSVRASLLYHLRVIGGLTTGVTLVLVLLAPVGLAVLYGPGAQVGVFVLILTGVGTVLFALGNLATQTLIGMRRASVAAIAWTLAAIVATIGLAMASPTLIGASAAVLIGVAVGCVGVGGELVRRFAPAAEEAS